MLGFTIILLSVGSVFCGVSIRMPYLNPAGVTYTSYEGASPFLNSQFGLRSFAYGNAYSVQGPVAVAHAPLVAAAPVVAAPLVPAVKHVPAVAHVPVTKYEAHPAVIQDVVDVHKAKIATKKFEIRRPAIEKEFFDVEERIVVRPAGKAVVELDEPVSKNQRGPTVVSPAPELAHVVHAAPVAVTRTVPVAHAVHAVHAVHTPVIAATAHPIHVPALAHPVHVEAPAHVISSTPAPFDFPQQSFPQPAQPDFPQQPSFPQQPQDFPQQPSFPQQPQDFPQNFPQQPQQPQQFDDSDSVSVENPEIARARIQQLPQPDRELFRSQQLFRAQQANDLLRSQQIEGQRIQQLQGLRQDQLRPQPELFRSQQINADLIRSQQIEGQRIQQLQGLRQNQLRPQPDLFRSQQVNADLIRSQQIEGELFQNEQIARQQQVERQQFDRQQQNARDQFERQQQAQERRFQIEQIERLFQQPQPVDRRIQPSGLDRQMQDDLQARLLQQQPQRFDQPGPPQRLEEDPQLPNLNLLRIRPIPRPDERIQANSRTGEIPRQGPVVESISRAPEIPSFRLSQEQSISNQQRLIDLLTARGGVTEVRGPGENSLGGSQVRTRVLSVTPAPLEARSQDEKVNTRRIVVNRPITTVEEVDVVEPFTKIERVAVHQPALIKTAKVGVASVQTSVPVQTYAHALPF